MPRNASSLSAEKPLAGAVLCCTSILAEDRTQLAEHAQEMGAEHTLDLTSDVTHLIVGETGSEKYQYVAREREDVKVLKPEWVYAVRDIWMADQPLNLNALEAEFRVPTFFGLKICITGFEDLAFRNAFAQDIQKNGGTYTGDLTKDVTHLIAYTPSGKKYEYATIWHVKVVSVKWYKDSLDRGMQLDESVYHPALSPEKQGQGAWNRMNINSPKLGKRAREDQPKVEVNRKLRRTASTKFGSQHQEIWNDIVGQNGTESSTDQATEGAMKSSNLPLQSFSSDAQSRITSDHVESIPKSTESPAGILHGKHFAIRGFDEKRKELLSNALVGLDAHIHASVTAIINQVDIEPNNRFMVIPLETEANHIKLIEQKCPGFILVTELWVEWCITMKNFVSPDTYQLGRPAAPIMLPAISKLSINTTGFHQVQTMHIAKVVSRIGAQYQEIFTPETSVLVCNLSNANRQKIIHAMAWKIPVVTEKWLAQLLTQERVPSFEHYTMVQPSVATTMHDSTEKRSRAEPRIVEEKKSKALFAGGDGQYEPLNDGFDVAQDEQEQQSTTSATENPLENKNRPQLVPDNHTDRLMENSKIQQQQRIRTEQTTNARHLRELSPNIQPRKASEPKKKMFRTLDGLESAHNGMALAKRTDSGVGIVADEDIENTDHEVNAADVELQPNWDHGKHDVLMKEFFEIKAAAAAKTAELNKRPVSSKSKEKKLFGRALSNLSNSSRTSNDNNKDDPTHRRQTLSRASSIQSVNTDGLGLPLSAISRMPSDPNGINRSSEPRQGANLQRTNSRTNRQGSDNVFPDVSKLTSFHAQLLTFTNSQPVRAASPPPRSQDQGQLTYADTAEAVKLRAQLAEKRRARAKLDQTPTDLTPRLNTEDSEEKRQQEWRDMERRLTEGGVLRDDEALVGGGRRTRGREKALAGLENGKTGDEEWGAGVLL